MEFIREERQTPIKDRCRVLVAGGGYAGVSAALAAARGGADVLLLEREFILGGLGTAGLITIYLPICDGMGHQVSFGIAEELLRLVVQNGLEGELPQTWFREASAEERRNGPRFMVCYKPADLRVGAGAAAGAQRRTPALRNVGLRRGKRRRERGESCEPVTMATIPELRMTRRLVGETDVCARDDHRRCERSVGMFSDWTKRGPVYELPFGALYHPSVPNLLTAGRCLSAADDLWNVTRVIPVCAVSGEAAGTAAALGCDFPALDIAALQETLRAQGVRVHLDEL